MVSADDIVCWRCELSGRVGVLTDMAWHGWQVSSANVINARGADAAMAMAMADRQAGRRLFICAIDRFQREGDDDWAEV